jgi:hypothetical protein
LENFCALNSCCKTVRLELITLISWHSLNSSLASFAAAKNFQKILLPHYSTVYGLLIFQNRSKEAANLVTAKSFQATLKIRKTSTALARQEKDASMFLANIGLPNGASSDDICVTPS